MGAWLGNDVSYATAHARPRTLWGRASQYSCVNCGASARDWAYDGTDPTQLFGPNCVSKPQILWHYYSAWPEFYMPMCVACHRRKDKIAVQMELREYRAWKHRTGRTLADA